MSQKAEDSVVMLDYPMLGNSQACTVCGGSGRVGVLGGGNARLVSVSPCCHCEGTGKSNRKPKGEFQFTLLSWLIVTALIPPVLTWGIWLAGVLNPLGCIFALLPGAFYLLATGLCVPFRSLRWLSVVSLVFCAASVSFTMAASRGPEFLEAGLGVAVWSTALGGVVLASLAVASMVVMLALRTRRQAH